jgi:xanthine dehydrogenase accessory factor
MRQLLEAALEATRNGETVALATIVRAQGSTPRATGAKMLVFRDGTIQGTVGGGEMEGRVIQEALAALETGQPRMTHYTYREVEEAGVGICGGENDVFIDVLGPAKELLIVGAGHVGKPSRTRAFLGMDCVVMDHRAEFANQQRFRERRSWQRRGAIAAPVSHQSADLCRHRHARTRAGYRCAGRGDSLAAAYIGMIAAAARLDACLKR